jgi:hypothetical protein
MKTTIYSVLCVGIRLGAVLMAVDIVEQAPVIFVYPSQPGFSAGAVWFACAGLTLAFLLWLSPQVLARWAVGRSSHEVLEMAVSADQIQSIAFSIVGIWLFIGGLTGVVARVVMMLVVARRSAYGDSTRVLSSGDWYWLVLHVATAVAGASLAVGAAGLVRLFHRVRGYPYAAERELVDNVSHTRDS